MSAALDTLPAIAELAQLDQWVVWKYVTRKGKQDKPPFNVASGQIASHSEPADWSSYAAALAALKRYAGLGFVFSEYDPYSGVDLDGCRDLETGTIEPWAQRIIDLLDSYTEVSPSGTGVKIFCRGVLPASIKHALGPHKGIEIYSSRRYFTVTGQHLAGTPTAIRDAQAALDTLAVELRPAPAPRPAAPARKITPGEQAAERASLDDVRARFNAEHTIAQLLADYGAKATPGGYSCPFCEHTHETTLYISKQGRLFSYSPLCTLHTTKGWDAFGLYVTIEHQNNIVAALKALNPIAPKAKAEPRQTPDYITPGQAQQRRQDAQRKRNARRSAAAATRQAIEDQAAGDPTLSPAARRQLNTHLALAGDRGWHRASVARQAEHAGVGERAVQFANADLIERGYLSRQLTSGTTTAIWTFTPRSPVETSGGERDAAECDAENDDRSPVLDHETYDLFLPLGACERAPIPPEPARDADGWSWSDPAYGAEDLAALENLTKPDILVGFAPVLCAERSQQGAPALPSRINWALVDAILAADPAEATAIAQGQLLAAPEDDAPGADYIPALDFTAGGRCDLSSWRDPREMRPRDDQVDQAENDAIGADDADPLVRCAPTEPRAAAEYWSLKHKKPVSVKQATWIRRRLAELEVWRPASQVAGAIGPPTRGSPRGVSPRALTSSAAIGVRSPAQQELVL